MVYEPKHHRSEKNGLVYEHILVAERKIGRALKPTEVVHHIDSNRSNNSEENLVVFKTTADHIRHHSTGYIEPVGDGSYISPLRKLVCEYCGDIYENNSDKRKYCSEKCSSMSKRLVIRPSKEELYSLIREKSFVSIGKEYGVSDNAVRNWCKKYGLPFRKKDIKTLK